MNDPKETSGRLIVFEGIDGTGKSTQIRLLAEALKRNGYQVLITREPTDGRFGRKIRALYSNRDTLSADEELELFIADRKEHLETVLRPALANGQIVLCDRYFLSTAAYQGAKGLDPEKIIALHEFAPAPDLALILELDPAECIRRITQQRGDRLNDFEQFEALQKVDGIFRQMKLPYIRRIKGSATETGVHRQVLLHLEHLLQPAEPLQPVLEHL